MIEENFHRLLKRQLKRFSLPDNNDENLRWFLSAVSDAYFDFDQSMRHLENILEVSSNELFKKTQTLAELNKSLSQAVEQRTRQVHEQNIELAQFAEATAAQRDVLEAKASALERANRLITQSIQYARRLQDVMLPQRDMLRKFFPESFLLYKPKDIISGDFYWLFERRDKIIFGLIDCTGHGVPGAFMSLLVNDMLRLIVEVKNILEPGEILTELHQEIRKAFKQAITLNNDGADAAICQWDKKAKILRFAGAKLSLYYLDEPGEFKVLRGERLSLGGSHNKERLDFEEQIVHLKSDLIVYLSTDGFADQFGGENKTRLGKNRFTTLLRWNSSEPFEKQSMILGNFFEQWMSTFPQQLDDVTVLGLRLKV